MKTSMALGAIKNMVFSAIVLIPLQFNMGGLPNNNNMEVANLNAEAPIQLSDELPPSAEPKVVLLDLEKEYCDIECFLSEHKSTLEFISKTFQIDYNVIYDNLVLVNDGNYFDEYNIGNMKNTKGEPKSFNSFEEGLIEYLFDFAKKNPSVVSKKMTPYTGDAGYVENLIKYFTNIYKNVDYTTAISIGAAESGYYQVKYMLRCNNVFGGMSSNGLIKYKNIEYGTLSYIRMLSRNYYGKGLTTVESIGRVYCPTYNASGYKIASPHWVNLVRTAMNKYANSYTDVSVDLLLNK